VTPVRGKTRSKPDREQLLEKLAGLTNDARRQNFLQQHRSLLQVKVVSELAEKVVEQVRVDVHRALRLADAAIAISQKLKNKESKATVLRAKANVLYLKGEHAAAADHHEQAAALFEAAGQPNQVARTLSSSMQPLHLMGEYNRAFAAAERARKIFASEGDSWRLARLDINLGNIYYRQDRFDEALASYERAFLGLPA
jgi:tetratricopeptide (TPR) repeat protein